MIEIIQHSTESEKESQPTSFEPEILAFCCEH